jgi:hypothetical protein
MTNVWSQIDPYWHDAQDGAWIDAHAIWQPRGMAAANYIRAYGCIQSFVTPEAIGIECPMTRPDPYLPADFNPLNLRIEQGFQRVFMDRPAVPVSTIFTFPTEVGWCEVEKEQFSEAFDPHDLHAPDSNVDRNRPERTRPANAGGTMICSQISVVRRRCLARRRSGPGQGGSSLSLWTCATGCWALRAGEWRGLSRRLARMPRGARRRGSPGPCRSRRCAASRVPRRFRRPRLPLCGRGCVPWR